MTFKDLQYGDPVEAAALMECGESEIPDTDILEPSEGEPIPFTPRNAPPSVRHLAVAGQPTTLCGLTERPSAVIHPSKARKTDCPACRVAWRRLKAMKPKFIQTSVDVRPAPVPEKLAPLKMVGRAMDDANKRNDSQRETKIPNGVIRDNATIIAEVLRLRASGLPYMAIEAAMGWPDQHGTQAFRICKKHGGR